MNWGVINGENEVMIGDKTIKSQRQTASIILLVWFYIYGIGFIPDENLYNLATVGLGAWGAYLLCRQGHTDVFKPRSFNLKVIGKVSLAFLVYTLWAMFAGYYFPTTQNQIQIDAEVYSTDIDVIIFYIFSILIAPICEETVFRGLIMKNITFMKKIGVDCLVSSTLFSLGHVLIHGFVLTDFILYFGMGLVLSVLFKYSKTIYPVFILHILWNAFVLWVKS